MLRLRLCELATPLLKNLEVHDGKLKCRVQEANRTVSREAAVLSFTSRTFHLSLQNPTGIFRTPELQRWAFARGLIGTSMKGTGSFFTSKRNATKS